MLLMIIGLNRFILVNGIKKSKTEPVALPWIAYVQKFGKEFYPPHKQLIINDLYSFITDFLPFLGCKGTKNFLKTMKMNELKMVGYVIPFRNDDYSVIE